MLEKIAKVMREYVFGLSIITTVVGLFLLFMGIIYYWFSDVALDFIQTIGEWNAYVLVIGLVIFGIGLWYLYSYLKNRKFVLDELKTNRRSEFLKRHNELKDTVKLLPSKYKKLLDDKESELRIK